MITSVAVLVAAQLPGIRCESVLSLLTAGLLLGAVNALIRPVLLLLSLPLIVVTFGLFIPVVNALMLGLVAFIVPGFHVNSFGSAFFGSIVISIISGMAGALFRNEGIRIHRMTAPARMKQASGRVLERED